jgi:hypothetical protein
MPHTSRRTTIRDDFEVSPRIVELAHLNGWPDPFSQRDAFVDYHLSRGSLMADWEAAFRTWLRNAQKYQRPTPPPQPHLPSVYTVTHRPLTPEERAENQRRVIELTEGIGKKI